jgi:hypothetical protein
MQNKIGYRTKLSTQMQYRDHLRLILCLTRSARAADCGRLFLARAQFQETFGGEAFFTQLPTNRINPKKKGIMARRKLYRFLFSNWKAECPF